MGSARTATLALALLVAARAPARAAETDAERPAVAVAATPSPVVTRTHAIGVDVGMASAVGAFGITFTRAFGEAFRVEAGVGAGGYGIQLSLMPKLVLGSACDHFVTGVGVAYTFPLDANAADDHPVWLNVDALGYEHLFASGFSFSIAAGFARGLGGGRVGSEDVSRVAGAQARMGIAYWF